ncbi:MAG: hypothetical protein CME15_10035 [Gemmatimonadetes bacterium]|jgi:hypothetical protein|nr:hypothetical protein [Gemmatimonadota bacterium]
MELLKARQAVLHGKETTSYATGSTIAASLEILGLLLFVYALMSYETSEPRDLRLSIWQLTAGGTRIW